MIIMNDDNEGKLSIGGVYTKRITAKKITMKKIMNQNNNKINK